MVCRSIFEFSHEYIEFVCVVMVGDAKKFVEFNFGFGFGVSEAKLRNNYTHSH